MYLEPCKTAKMKVFVKIINVKSYVLAVLTGPEYVSEICEEHLGVQNTSRPFAFQVKMLQN